jgi:ABC-type polysaccharide transport system permease subunit
MSRIIIFFGYIGYHLRVALQIIYNLQRKANLKMKKRTNLYIYFQIITVYSFNYSIALQLNESENYNEQFVKHVGAEQ